MLSPNSHNTHYVMNKRRCEAPPTHVYHIKRDVKLLNTRYTQHESICRRDVKLFLHIVNTNQNFWVFYFKQNLRFQFKIFKQTSWYQIEIIVHFKHMISIEIKHYSLRHKDTNWNYYQLKILFSIKQGSGIQKKFNWKIKCKFSPPLWNTNKHYA